MNISSRRQPSRLTLLSHSGLRFATLFLFDAVICVASLWFGLRLRFDGVIPAPFVAALPLYATVLVPSRLLATFLLRVHRWSFRLSGLLDAVRVAVASLVGTGLFVLVVYFTGLLAPPRSVVVLELLVSGLAMMTLRFGPRLAAVYWRRLTRARSGQARRTLIVGAGTAGELLFRDLERSGDHPYRVVGFIDEDPAKWPNLLHGRRVFGGLARLPDVIERERIDTILIAIPRDSQAVVRDVVSRCAGLGVAIKALPVSFVYAQQTGAARTLQELSPDDLLSRRRVVFDEAERSSFPGRRVLVTGAAGSIGSEICRQLMSLGVGRLVAVDISENGLYLLEQSVRRRFGGDRFLVELADIRDAGRIDALIRRHRPQDVIHAAAHKHVPLMETAPCEAVKNNILGTRHVLEAAERLPVECVVFISSDKAVAPRSVMGATKRVGELMTRAVAMRSGVRGCSVRFGNVLGSDGSVVPLFREQIEAGGPVTVTHEEVERYFMTIPEAVGLVLKAAYGKFGDLCVLDMGEPIRIIDLARQMIALAGLVPDVDIPIVVTGLRPGEKLQEELTTDDEEVTLRAAGQIKVLTGPPPGANLWDLVGRLRRAASAEDADDVLAVLRQLVPTYQSDAAPPVDPQERITA